MPVLALPFVGPQGNNNSYVVSGLNPVFGNLSGGTTVYSRMELFGQQANGVLNLGRSTWAEWDLLAGTRFLQLHKRLDLTSTSRVLPASTTLLGLEDHFQTFDKFYGGQLGTKAQRLLRPLLAGGTGNGGPGGRRRGNTQQGTDDFPDAAVHLVQPHGLFVLPSNSGSLRGWPLAW